MDRPRWFHLRLGIVGAEWWNKRKRRARFAEAIAPPSVRGLVAANGNDIGRVRLEEELEELAWRARVGSPAD